jgi:hypothetical protein
MIIQQNESSAFWYVEILDAIYMIKTERGLI